MAGERKGVVSQRGVSVAAVSEKHVCVWEESRTMAEPFHEIVLAPTGRATCACRKHKIELGQLKLVSWYVPRGRNHMECTSKALVCIGKTMAKAVMAGQTEAGVPVLDKTNELPTANAYLACESIVKAIAAGGSVSEADAAFREVPVAKPRASKKKREGGGDGDSAKRVCGLE